MSNLHVSRVRKLRTGGYSVVWIQSGVKHAKRLGSLTAAKSFRDALLSPTEPRAWHAKGGKARAATLSAERRSEIASKAALARWGHAPQE